ncbi:MAG: hypothetical protein LAT66_11710 [Alkalimonas sp.]|nr:hypothetical protein [Alkalimonas sp.]
MIAASGAVTSAAFAELKQQMALRTAEQAEREAESLKSEANEKRQEAREIAEEARNLQLESGQAQNRADSARASLPPDNLLQQLDQQFSSIISALNPQTEQESETEASVVEPNNTPQTINMLGQPTGGTIDITV